jgi:hypothetical protein
MKNFIALIFTLFSITLVAKAQSTSASSFVVLMDSAHDNKKMLEGIITKNDLINDTAFSWYAESQRIYPKPDADAVEAFSKNKDKIYFLFLAEHGAKTRILFCLNFIKFRRHQAFRKTGSLILRLIIKCQQPATLLKL